MLKKVAKALDEMAKNEELMEGILAAAVGDMDGEGDADMERDEDEEEMDGKLIGGGQMIEQPEGEEGEGNERKGGERLGTIGEDGDEDK